MSIEELLKPRIKVIERWPDMDKNKYYVGQIITLPCYEISSKQWFIQDGESKIYDAYFENYPHLFKRLEWWEEMDEKDMPEYVGYKFLEDSKEKILKVPNHFADSNGVYNKRIFCIERVPYSYSKCRIATKEEYEQYLQSQK